MPQQQPLDENDREDLVAYLDGELGEQEARALEARLHIDANARNEAESLKRAWDMLEYLPRPEPSPNFTHRTIERLTAQQLASAQQKRGVRGWLFRAGWAAAIFLAFLAGFAATKDHLQRRQVELDQQLARDLNIVENLRAFENVDDIDFLHKLANPNDQDLFGDERQEL